jgi:hypothetical protein
VAAPVIPADLGPTPAPAATTAVVEALAAGLAASVPTKRVGKNLLIGTWNIAMLGGLTNSWETGPNDSPKRNLTDLCCIAEIINRFDVCAIQETKTKLTALRTVMRVLGSNWGFVVSDAEKRRRAQELEKIAQWLDARANEPDEFNRNMIGLGDFNIDRLGDDYWYAFASTGLGAPKELQDVPRNIAAASGGTTKFYDQIAWFQEGDLAKLTLGYQTAGYFKWTDLILQGASHATKKARISDHYPLWAAFSLD